MESSNKVEDADACRKKRRRNLLKTETSSHEDAAAAAVSSSASAAPTTASASTTPPPPPLLWYTPTELRSIQRSLIRAVRSYDRHSNTSLVTNTDQDDDEEDADVLEYYSTRKRYERRNKRHRMLKTCRAVQEFAATIHTPVPLTELLSQLLHRYSSSSS